MSKTELILKTSEDATLTNRGYKLLKKLSEGTYAKVILRLKFITNLNFKVQFLLGLSRRVRCTRYKKYYKISMQDNGYNKNG